MQIKNINWQGASIQYQVTGQGKTVVLLHGFGEDSTVWQPQIEFLQQYFRLIIPDIPGSGQSQFVPNANIETYADILKEIIIIELKNLFPSGEGWDGAFSLIGHSMGGYITLAFAEKYPEYLNSFGLFHSSAFADTGEKKETRRKAIGFIQSKGGYAFLKTSIPGLFTKEYYAVNKNNYAWPDRISAKIYTCYDESVAAQVRKIINCNGQKTNFR